MLSNELQQKIIELNKMHIPKVVIAKQIGCSTTAVYNCLKRSEIVDPMIGQHFGKLTVIERSNTDKHRINRCIYYKCKCDCGNE